MWGGQQNNTPVENGTLFYFCMGIYLWDDHATEHNLFKSARTIWKRMKYVPTFVCIHILSSSHFFDSSLCNHISSTVFGFWQRDRYSERGLKCIELLKRTTCCPSLSLNTCRMWSAFPAATGWTSVTTHTSLHTHKGRATPRISSFKEEKKKEFVSLLQKALTHTLWYVHRADHLPSSSSSLGTVTQKIGSKWTCVLFFPPLLLTFTNSLQHYLTDIWLETWHDSQ